MYHQQDFIYVELHSDACLYEEREFLLININAFLGELGFHPHAGGPPLFLDWYLEHQFNSTSRTLSEAIGKLVLLM